MCRGAAPGPAHRAAALTRPHCVVPLPGPVLKTPQDLHLSSWCYTQSFLQSLNIEKCTDYENTSLKELPQLLFSNAAPGM